MVRPLRDLRSPPQTRGYRTTYHRLSLQGPSRPCRRRQEAFVPVGDIW